MNDTSRGPASASPPGFGVTWGGPPRVATRSLTVVAAAALIAGMAGPAVAATPTASSAAPVSVIVLEQPSAGDRPEKAVAAYGGTVEQPLGIVGGFVASVPADRIDALRATPGIRSVTEDAAVELHDADTESQVTQTGSLYTITHELTGAANMWDRGFTGRGVDVAVIDSGVVPVDGLRSTGKVVFGPDLSFESQFCEESGCSSSPVRNLDTYGHGTSMAGIIAGRSDAVTSVTAADTRNFMGVAPDARIVSVKVADAYGATDVSQVIAAIDWVVQNRQKNGLNIRVLNLSFGTDGVQDYLLDPLAYAAEQAWHAGIAVVVAAGNGGYGTPKLDNPAYDPFVIAVGALDSLGTHGTGDDVIPSWSSTGDRLRNPDVVAHGSSVVSLRSPGSFLDNSYPNARVGERFFRGSGTSQSAAVVSGAAALLIQQRPGITPDQLKALLKNTAMKLPSADAIAQGKGMVDLRKAANAKTPMSVQAWARSTGLGSLQAARGTSVPEYSGVKLEGEVDVMGRPWNGVAWTLASSTRTAWSGGSFGSNGWEGGAWLGQDWYQTSVTGTPAGGLAGLGWSGLGWSGLGWSSLAWAGLGWSGDSWSGRGWSGLGWSGLGWSGLGWSGLGWSGLGWSGLGWSGLGWSGLGWSGLGWSGLGWSG